MAAEPSSSERKDSSSSSSSSSSSGVTGGRWPWGWNDESLSDCRTVRSGCGLTAAWAAGGMLLWRARSSPGRPDAVRAMWRGSRLRGPRGGACLQRARRAIKYCSAASRAAVVRCRGLPESTWSCSSLT